MQIIRLRLIAQEISVGFLNEEINVKELLIGNVILDGEHILCDFLFGMTL